MHSHACTSQQGYTDITLHSTGQGGSEAVSTRTCAPLRQHWTHACGGHDTFMHMHAQYSYTDITLKFTGQEGSKAVSGGAQNKSSSRRFVSDITGDEVITE